MSALEDRIQATTFLERDSRLSIAWRHHDDLK
jgi:hypothetical protein